MNQKQRDRLAAICDQPEDIATEEREKFENLPEGLQSSEKGEKIEEAADTIDAAIDELRELVG